MGWDYYTYYSQPPRFIEEISLIMFHEAQAEQRQYKSAKNKSALKKNPRSRLRR